MKNVTHANKKDTLQRKKKKMGLLKKRKQVRAFHETIIDNQTVIDY